MNLNYEPSGYFNMGNHAITLHKAKTEKNDEFYTQYEDIEKELLHYKDDLKGKRVLLPCNDANKNSNNFYMYLKNNFNFYGLKSIKALEYRPWAMGRVLTFDGIKEEKDELMGSGSYNSPEALEFVDEVDIVITNPPFSVAKDFLNLLVRKNKDFILVVPQTVLNLVSLFPYVQSYKIHTGFTSIKNFKKNSDGSIAKFGNIVWITTLHVEDKPFLPIIEQDISKFKRFDNYSSILNIDKLEDIPKNFDGVMGVPITILAKFNPKQFKILGTSDIAVELKDYLDKDAFDTDISCVEGKKIFKRIFIQNIK